MTTPEVLVEKRAGVGYIVVNRPRAINALTPSMFVTIREVLDTWADDDSVEQIDVSGAGDRGLCAGADVRALRQWVLDGGDPAEPLAQEYAMNAAIVALNKPYIAHLRGITMGGGLGLSVHGSRRLVYPDARLAMPETAIGFIPDVGVLWLLARAPGELGTHLALAGATVNASDGVLVGWADEVVGQAPLSELVADRSWVDACYAGDDPLVIVERLEQHPDPRARTAGDLIRRRSPLAVAVALEAVRRAASLPTVQDVLAQDLTVARHLVPRPDFAEGVRAQLVDKDRHPQWNPARLEDVDRSAVLACFAEGSR